MRSEQINKWPYSMTDIYDDGDDDDDDDDGDDDDDDCVENA